PNRDEPSRPGLQPEANDYDLRCGTPDGSDQNVIALFKATRPSRSTAVSALAPRGTQCVGPCSNPFFHGLGLMPTALNSLRFPLAPKSIPVLKSRTCTNHLEGTC